MSGLNRPLGGPILLTAILVGMVFCCFCAFPPVLAEVPLFLAFGWVPYLRRVVPEMKPDPESVATAVVCLAGFVVGSHLFLRWLYAATDTPAEATEPRQWPRRWTLHLTGLVILMFVAGITVTGVVHQTGWLIHSPEPLVNIGEIRAPAARTYSMINLSQMAKGAHNYASASPDGGELPAATFDSLGRPLHSWQTQILPFIDQSDAGLKRDLPWNHPQNFGGGFAGRLEVGLKHDLPWNHPQNQAVTAKVVNLFLHSSIAEQTVDGYGASHYAGNAAVVIGDRPKNLNRTDDFSRGAANTILAGEVAAGFRPWADPLNARDPRRGTGGGPDAFGSPLRGQKPQFAMCDASVRTFDPKELADLMAGKVPE